MKDMMTLEPQNMTEAMEFSTMLSKSQLVPKDYVGKPENILVAVVWGKEIGLAPMQAMQNIAVINGRPSIYGDAMLAIAMAHPSFQDIHEVVEGEGKDMVATCTVKRKGRSDTVAQFSMADAEKANLAKKPGPWTQYPARMLKMRARGFALRDAMPDVLRGLVTAEEAMDTPVEKDVKPSLDDVVMDKRISLEQQEFIIQKMREAKFTKGRATAFFKGWGVADVSEIKASDVDDVCLELDEEIKSVDSAV